MKTKELIKILQEADPTGECHVRLLANGEYYCDFYTEYKDGYWDGPYSYLIGNWGKDMVCHYTTTGSKVDLCAMDIDRFVEFFNGNYEEIKKHITFDFNNFLNKEDREDRENSILKLYKNSCDEYHNILKVNNIKIK